MIRLMQRLRVAECFGLSKLGVMLLAITLVGAAEATVTVAKRAKFTGRVSVQGKAPNTELWVWQSSRPGGENYVNTGFTITTDASGNGTVSIPNTASGTLLLGHNVKVGSFREPDRRQHPLPVTRSTWFLDLFESWFASITPGIHGPSTGTLAQAVISDGTTLLETWDVGTIIKLRLDPSQAQWINFDANISPRGDLIADLEITSDTITIEILEDPSITTIDDLVIEGIGLNVIASPGQYVDMYLEWVGSTSEYLNGEFLQQHVWTTPQTYLYDRLTVVPEPASLVALAVGLVGLAYRRRRAA